MSMRRAKIAEIRRETAGRKDCKKSVKSFSKVLKTVTKEILKLHNERKRKACFLHELVL